MELSTWTLSLLQIAAGSLIVGLAISYAIWCRIRVIFLRQDLFRIRDELWMVARRKQRLDDPAYVEARELFNACIRGASFISFPQLVNGLVDARNRGEEVVEQKSSDPDLDKAIDDAYAQLVERLGKYVLRDRFVSGIALGLLALVTLGSVVKLFRFLQMLIESWRKTQGPKTLSAAEARLHST